MAALKQTGMKRVVVAGGVGANKQLREQLNEACAKHKIRVHYPELHLCTDNGAMIAAAAIRRARAGMLDETSTEIKPWLPLAP